MNYISVLKHYIPVLSILAVCSQGIHNIAFASELSQKAPPLVIKMDEIDLYHAVKQRPVKLDLWYRETGCVDQNCELTPAKKLNIAILTHGAMGSAKDYSWLAYPLAAQGWIVVGVNHFGESWRYGKQNIDPTSIMRFWQRTEDVSFVIDSFETFLPQNIITSKANIVVIGHSSGGYTAAALAGVTLDSKQMYDYCASKLAKGDLGCSYGEKTNPKQPEVAAQSIAPVLDSRVTGIVMLDPALGPAATKTSLNKVRIPTLIIGSENNDFLPFEYHAKYYAQNIPNAKLFALNNDEGHFVSDIPHPLYE
tara:strand:+ start:264 stop:1187 length:924 start_codon:yes stop_codon:yes gene_type:complete